MWKTWERKTTKYSLKTTEVLLDADEYVLTWVWYLSNCSSSKLFQELHKFLMSWFLWKKRLVWCPIWNLPRNHFMWLYNLSNEHSPIVFLSTSHKTCLHKTSSTFSNHPMNFQLTFGVQSLDHSVTIGYVSYL